MRSQSNAGTSNAFPEDKISQYPIHEEMESRRSSFSSDLSASMPKRNDFSEQVSRKTSSSSASTRESDKSAPRPRLARAKDSVGRLMRLPTKSFESLRHRNHVTTDDEIPPVPKPPGSLRRVAKSFESLRTRATRAKLDEDAPPIPQRPSTIRRVGNYMADSIALTAQAQAGAGYTVHGCYF